MKGKVLKRLGFPDGKCRDLAKKAVSELMGQGISETEIMETLKKLSEKPLLFADNPVLGKASKALAEMKQARALFEEREIPAPYVRWGNDIEASAISQMNAACRLPVAVRGALMPDAHEGYGLPIGGVLAARNAVIPFAVGMDIACRMKLSVLDIPLKIFSEDMDRFRKAINAETRFGTGASLTLMGDFSSANHRLVHSHIAGHLGAEIIADVENHHNFAWKETHFGEELIVHRKGATPAAYGVLGVIPGSMTAPAYVVKGKGNPESLDSASHGAGRKMSRSAAIRMFSRKDMDAILSERGVKLISGGIDEVPMAYKDIEPVWLKFKGILQEFF